MAPKIVNNVSELTRESIADLYFKSLESKDMRPIHAPLIEATAGGRSPTPPNDLVLRDFTGWYGGMLSLAQAIDPGVALPGLKECGTYITQNFERVKSAIAA